MPYAVRRGVGMRCDAMRCDAMQAGGGSAWRAFDADGVYNPNGNKDSGYARCKRSAPRIKRSIPRCNAAHHVAMRDMRTGNEPAQRLTAAVTVSSEGPYFGGVRTSVDVRGCPSAERTDWERAGQAKRVRPELPGCAGAGIVPGQREKINRHEPGKSRKGECVCVCARARVCARSHPCACVRAAPCSWYTQPREDIVTACLPTLPDRPPLAPCARPHASACGWAPPTAQPRAFAKYGGGALRLAAKSTQPLQVDLAPGRACVRARMRACLCVCVCMCL
jgi:hypothetical protein